MRFPVRLDAAVRVHRVPGTKMIYRPRSSLSGRFQRSRQNGAAPATTTTPINVSMPSADDQKPGRTSCEITKRHTAAQTTAMMKNSAVVGGRVCMW